MAPISKKEKIKAEKMKEFIMKMSIEREIQEIGREPLPGEIEAVMERRKMHTKSVSPIIRYHKFYDDIKHIIPDIKKEIDRSTTKEIKIDTKDMAKKVNMSNIHPGIIDMKLEPILMMEGISIHIGDKGKFFIMRNAAKEDRLSKFPSQRINRICTTDPQTDSPKILNFLDKLCKLR